MRRLPPTEFRMCRMGRSHAMDDYQPGPDDYRGPGWGRTFHLRCTRCGVVRAVTIDALGNIAASKYYDYPDGYKVPRDEAPSCAELRVDYANRRRVKNKGAKPRKRAGR